MRVFKETQRFNQWWLRLLVIAVMGVCIAATVNAFDKITEDPTQFWVILIISTLTIVILIFLLVFTRLETKIDEKGIHYKFWPFNLSERLLSWREISSCEVRKYSPISEYGGWGYRTGFTKNSGALNVKGNKGIQIELKNGKKLLLGTQKGTDVNAVLKTYSGKLIS